MALEGWLDIPDEPFVKHAVQVDVREERRDHPSLRRSFIGVRELITLKHPGVQPLSDQTQQHAVAYPSAKDVPEVEVIDGVEELPDVDLDDPSSIHLPCRVLDRVQRLMRRAPRS